MDSRHGGPTKRNARASHDLVAPLKKFGLPAKERDLAYGDLYFLGHGPNGTLAKVGVELKKLDDVLGSMDSGRLVDQAEGMIDLYDFRYLLVQGIFRPDPHSGMLTVPGPMRRGKRTWVPAGHGKRRMLFTDFLSALNSYAVIAGMRLLRATNQLETLWTVAALYSWWDKPWEKHTSLKKLATPPLSVIPSPLVGHRRKCECPRCTFIRMAAQLPDLGWVRARSAEEHFGGEGTTLRTALGRMVTANEKDWQEIEGVGTGISRTCVRVLRERYAEPEVGAGVRSK